MCTGCNKLDFYKMDLCRDCYNHGIDVAKQPQPKFLESNEFKHNPSHRHLSCELEIDEFNYDGNLQQWMKDNGFCWTREGTVHGTEIHTPICNGDLFLRNAARLTKVLKENKAKITDDCGFHLHVDARDYTYARMDKLIRAYTNMERVFYDLLPYHRRDNHWCRPLQDIYFRKLCSRESEVAIEQNFLKKEHRVNFFIYRTTDPTTFDFRNKAGHLGRHGFNVAGWKYRGTVEIRMHEGTTSYKDISRWGILWANFLDKVPTLSLKTVKNLSPTIDNLCNLIPLLKKWINHRYHP